MRRHAGTLIRLEKIIRESVLGSDVEVRRHDCTIVGTTDVGLLRATWHGQFANVWTHLLSVAITLPSSVQPCGLPLPGHDPTLLYSFSQSLCLWPGSKQAPRHHCPPVGCWMSTPDTKVGSASEQVVRRAILLHDHEDVLKGW